VARLYEQQARLTREPQVRDERLQRAEQQITSVAQQSDAAPAHFAALIQFLIRHKRRDEATAWLDRLETQVQAMPKEDAGVLALVVQLQLQHESPRRTEKWLAKLESIDSTPLRALALKELTEAEAADRRYNRL
jgi:hypothetical protein